MNSFVDRFAVNGPTTELRKAKDILGEDEVLSDSTWGSQAGYGTLASGAPRFNMPSVADVCSSSREEYSISVELVLLPTALCLSEIAYRRPCRSFMQDQDQTWNYHTSI